MLLDMKLVFPQIMVVVDLIRWKQLKATLQTSIGAVVNLRCSERKIMMGH